MRQTRRHVRRQSDPAQEIGYSVARLAWPGKAVHDDWFGDRLARALAWIEAGERILKNHLHLLAQLAQGLRIERADIPPLKENAPPTRLDQPQD